MIPVWQPFVKCEDSPQEMLVIQKELFSLAKKGDLLVEFSQITGIISDRLQLSGKYLYKESDEASDLLI